MDALIAVVQITLSAKKKRMKAFLYGVFATVANESLKLFYFGGFPVMSFLVKSEKYVFFKSTIRVNHAIYC